MWEEYIEQEYLKACNSTIDKPTNDIKEHLPTLYNLGMECDRITEMGSRWGASSRAFLKTNAKFVAYDLELHPPLIEIFNKAKEAGKDVEYIKADVLKTNIDYTDLLFIDTWHTNPQLRQELAMHGNKSQKYLVFHDTHTFGVRNEVPRWWETPNHKAEPGQGLLPAIIDFMIDNPHWKFKEHRTNCNGLTILERI